MSSNNKPASEARKPDQSETAMPSATITVDGVEYQVSPETNLLQACLSQGLDLPYFCWHPCMGSVGACRQCAVKQYRDADDEQGMLVMACMTPATDGARLSIDDPQARDMRERVIESLMISHPHDCPVCEEGGECHLQDMTLMSGHNYRRYDKKKVTHRNQYLGPFINHEMNRCISCYRCVRYYDDYAGGTDLSAQASHHHVYFGRQQDGVLESEFSGNLVEVCPTGVFTDKVFSEHYSRKWDLQTAPAVCTACSAGCNITPGERYGELRRVVNRYNSEVNGYFLCDRGRFGFGYVNSDERFTAPYKRNKDGSEWTEETSREDALSVVASAVRMGMIGIGSPRASNEANFALRCLVGEENFYSGAGDKEFEAVQLMIQLLGDEAFSSPSIREIEQSDAVLVLDEDVTNTAPRIALAMRQSVRQRALALAEANRIPIWQDAAVRELAQHERSPLAIVSTAATRLDDVASDSLQLDAQGIVAMALAIETAVSGINLNVEQSAAVEALPADALAAAARIAEQLKTAKRPLIVSGSSGNGCVDKLKTAANIARALRENRPGKEPVSLCLLPQEVNALGLGLLCRPENTLSVALEKLAGGAGAAVAVLENDLYRRASTDAVDKALKNASTVIVADQLPNMTTARATLVLPTTAFSEQESSFVNYEGRAQLSYQVNRCHSGAMPAWRWFNQGQQAHVNDLIARCCAEVSNMAGLASLLPDPDELIAGLKIPRQSHRYSGRTAMKANLNVHEPKQAVDDESVMAFSMEGMPSQKDSLILASSWAPAWNSNQSISKFQEEVNGDLKQGHTGTRLIAAGSQQGERFTLQVKPAGLSTRGLRWSEARQIFGSDELSAHAPAIAERESGPWIGLSVPDAQRLGVGTGDAVTVNGKWQLSAIVRERQPEGAASLYAGGSLNVHDLPESIEIAKGGQADERWRRLLLADRRD